MALSGESLNSATATGPGTAIMFDEPKSVVAQITFAGSSSTFNVALEGTLDGVNWAVFHQFGTNVPGSYLISNSGDPPVMGVRANLTLAAGTVSAFLSATEF